MAKKDVRSYEFKIRELELELKEREKELLDFRQELSAINDQLESFISQMGSQLKMATLMQRALVPTEIPTISGFEFSTKFVASPISGSDYFDIFEMEDRNRFGVLMASSTGHGMAALFLSIVLKMSAQMEAKRGLSPDQILKKINEEIKGKVKDTQAVCVFLGLVDKKDLSMTYSLSGELFAYAFKNDFDKVVKLEMTQPPLGLSGKAPFKNESLQLEPRDRLILVSSGVGKVLNKKGEPFGSNRIQNSVVDATDKSLHEMRNEILFQAKKYSQEEEYPQDLSVIVMRVKDKVAKLKKL